MAAGDLVPDRHDLKVFILLLPGSAQKRRLINRPIDLAS
jgi:hypothetical protein